MIVGLAVAAWAVPAAAQKATITELGGDKTQGVIEVNASPDQVFAVMTDYANWRRVFTDYKKVSVKSGDREKSRVWFSSRALKDKATIEFDNEPGRLIRYRLVDGPPGARSNGQYTLTPLDGGKRTRVTEVLYLDVKGAAGLFIRSKTIRSRRQAKVRVDLEDLARHFE